MAQQGLAVVALLDRADPGRIAIHSMAFVVPVALEVVVVVTLRFPMFRSICSMFQDFVVQACQICVQSISYSSHSGNVKGILMPTEFP